MGVTLRIDLSGLPSERVRFAASPLAELTAMLHVLAAPGHHPQLAGWAADVWAGLRGDLTERLTEAEFLWRSSQADFLIPARTLARGPHTTSELAHFWELSPPEVSRHLAVLRRAGLLTARRHGRYVRYTLNLPDLSTLGVVRSWHRGRRPARASGCWAPAGSLAGATVRR
nr:hypothetical protein GCM10020063_032020 [Dactylosporangium thailandense]